MPRLLDPEREAASSRRPMIVADEAHVTYQVYASGKPVGVRSKLLGQRGGGTSSVHALRGVSFTASEGETVGVVGHNGSGKSTLFRALSGLIPTSGGNIWAADRPVLLGVNAALMPELSGESNIKLGLLAMGFSAEEAAAHVDEIADFAELNEFITHPMRTYSSGMGARLRFAIASARPHSILLLDEALAVGDRRFRLKSEARIRELQDAAGLVMIVSHSAGSLKDTCDRALWIHKGELRADGDAKAVVDEYTRWTKDPTSVAVGAATKPKPAPETAPTAAIAAATVAAATDATTTALTTATVTTGTTPTKPLAFPRDNPRDVARRERHRSAVRKRSRRRVITYAVTGGALVLAIGAGAAVALVTNQADRTELIALRATPAPTSTPTPTPTPTPVLPVINTFSGPDTVYCETFDSTAETVLTWDVVSAQTVGITSVSGENAPESVLSRQPASTGGKPAPFSCYNDSATYTLIATNALGQQVTSSITVLRELAPEPEADPVEEPVYEQPVEQAPAEQPVAPPVNEPAPPVEENAPPVEEVPPPVDEPAPQESTPTLEGDPAGT